MTIDEITDYIEGLGGVLTLAPQRGDSTPEISWGDRFFYYAPSGEVPKAQPFATIVTKDYPDDRGSRLDRPNTFRVNVAADAVEFEQLTGEQLTGDQLTRDQLTRAKAGTLDGSSDQAIADPAIADVVIAHPVYGSLKWVAIVNPGAKTSTILRSLLRASHGRARDRVERRAGVGGAEV
jgi:hypothetical protein